MKKDYSIKNIIIFGIFGRIKRSCFAVYEYFLPKLEIDEALFSSKNMEETTALLKSNYQNLFFETEDNRNYFDNMLHWVGADKHLVANPFFLYPPNVAVIDFLLKNLQKEGGILDYGSGLSYLLVYLRRLGFKNAFGYDDFSQISSATIGSFLKKIELSDIIISKQQALAFEASVVICICYYWSKLDRDFIEKEISNPRVKYILLDHYYAPRYIKHFKIMGIYKNLLVVFKRIS